MEDGMSLGDPPSTSPELFIRPEFSSIQSIVESEITLPTDEIFLENKCVIGFKGPPETLEELIQVEHSYAYICQDSYEEKGQFHSKTLQEKDSLGQPAISSSKTQVECDTNFLSEIMTVNILKDSKNGESIVCEDIYQNESDIPLINTDESNYDFQKKLRIILKDCQTDSSLSEHYNLRQKISFSADSDKLPKKNSFSHDSNDTIVTLQQPLKKRRIMKHNSLDDSKCTLKNLNFQNTSNNRLKEIKSENFETENGGIKTELLTENVFNTQRSVETNAITKSTNSRYQMKLQELKIKPTKLLPMPNKSRKSIEINDNTSTEKKQVSFIDSKPSTQVKKDYFDGREVIPLSPIITKCNKKKAIKREITRFIVNKDEPPLFSQPDMMIKIGTDDSSKKEVKDSEISNKLEELLELKNISVSLGKAEDTNNIVSFSDNSTVNVETVDNNLKLEASEESKILKETPPNECSDYKQGNSSLMKNERSVVEINTLDFSIDIPLHKNNDSEEFSQVMIDEKKQKHTENLSETKFQSSTMPDAEIKPGRKSSRLIKKKEFFEYVSEPPIAPAVKKKINAQKTKKEKAEKNKFISEIDEDEQEEEEDDPNKLWCICRKPHNNRFMIQCDTCEDWFHGTCVGVTKQQGVQLEKQEKEWICPSCRSKDQQILENPTEILQTSNKNKCIKNLKKEASNKDITNKSILSNNNKYFGGCSNVDNSIKTPEKHCKNEISHLEKHQKSQRSLLEMHQKNQRSYLQMHQKNQRSSLEMHQKNQCSHLERHPKNQSSPIEKHQKNQTTNCESVTDIKLKATQTKLQDKINVLSKKSNKELDKTFLSKNVSAKQHSKVLPISKMLFTNDCKKDAIKKENKSSKETSSIRKKPQKTLSKEMKTVQNHRHNCIQCQKIVDANSCYCSSECIEKHATQCLKTMRETGGSSKVQDWDYQRLVVFDRYKGNVITGEKGPKAGEIISWLKENPSFMIACSSSISSSKKDPNSKKECDSNSNIEKSTSKVNDVRMNVKKTLKNILMDRCKNSGDIILPEEEIRKIAVKIEEELYAQFKDTNLKYRTKYRSLMFNIKDPRNQGLFRKILRGEIAPGQVVHMTATELASVELSKWREQEMQHHLDMIKRVQLEQQKSGSLLKKTHKGEVEIEDDITIIEQDVLKAVPKSDADESFDVDKEQEDAANDTTQLHRSHLFDLNCKICTGKVVPPPDDSIPKKVRIAHSISVDATSPNTADFVSRAGERTSSISSAGDDSLEQEPTSTVSFRSPNINEEDCQIMELKSANSVWKGFIFMQDIAKFVTSAYKVSGQTDRLRSDLPDTIQVCGRIIPDQVWDYISKIKQSGNKELIIIQFQAANDEESVTYNTFYSYLNSRKRYGVVSNYSRKIKDFYIVPLAATSPVPTVLMPFDGPGLPSPRPHLLLGVIVRHKAKQAPQVSVPKNTVSKANELGDGSYTPPFEPRSYTPPLPAIDEQPLAVESEYSSSSNNCYESKPSFLLSEKQGKKTFSVLKNENESKEPEENKPYDPEQDILILSAEECGRKKKNLEEHKKILDALTKQVEETDREVSALKHYVSIPKSSTEGQCSEKEDINSVVESGMTTFLDIPENLQEILNTVRLKSGDSELNEDIDMRVNKSLINKLSFGLQGAVKEVEDKATPPSEEFEKAYPSDPRIKLRTPYQEASLKSLQDEMSTTTQKNSEKNLQQSTTSIPVRLMLTNWNQFREPPPPGIEPSELLIPDIFQGKPDDSVLHPVPPPPPPPPPLPPPHYVPSSIVQDKCCLSFPPPTISYQTHSVFSLSNIVQPSLAPPPLPIQTLPSKGNSDKWSSEYQPKKEYNENQWSYLADTSSGYRRKQTNKLWERRHNRGMGFRSSHRGHKFESKRGNNYRKIHRK